MYKCTKESALDCHSIKQTMCEMASSCWQNYKRQPKPSKKAYIDNECGS